MSTTTNDSTNSASSESQGAELVFERGKWISGWDPEDTVQWEREGKKIAHRNLGFSIYAEFLGFVVWALWAVVAVRMQVVKNAEGVLVPGPYGFALTSDQVLWLVATPAFVGATLRFPYTFLVSKVGGRNWTIISATLLLIPTIAMSFAIANHPVLQADGTYAGGTSYHALLWIAALAGFGGGNFASSMANINFFFPQRTKGWALGLNAAGGNIGSAVGQFMVPLIISITAIAMTTIKNNPKTGTVINLPIAGYFWIPFILAAMICAYLFMNNLRSAKADFAAYAVAFKDPHLWLMSFLYIGTFGSFIGLGGVFPKLINDIFPTYNTPIVISTATIGLSFLGPLVGSLSRPYGGQLADRFGGAIITVIAFLVMAVGTILVIFVLAPAKPSFWLFLFCFMLIFIATGVGNGSMYRMIPTVMAARAGQEDARFKSAGIPTVRKTAACLGIISAFGAYGGALVPFILLLCVGNYVQFMWWLMYAYVLFLAITVAFYIYPYAKKGTRV